jgi:hypothetical protein
MLVESRATCPCNRMVRCVTGGCDGGRRWGNVGAPPCGQRTSGRPPCLFTSPGKRCRVHGEHSAEHLHRIESSDNVVTGT